MSIMESIGVHEGVSVITSTSKAVGLTSTKVGVASKVGVAFSSGLAVGLLSGLAVATVGIMVISYVLDSQDVKV